MITPGDHVRFTAFRPSRPQWGRDALRPPGKAAVLVVIKLVGEGETRAVVVKRRDRMLNETNNRKRWYFYLEEVEKIKKYTNVKASPNEGRIL